MGSWVFAASQGAKKSHPANWWLLGPSQTPCAIQSLQSKWTVGENSFDIVKKRWNISNYDHHVQSLMIILIIFTFWEQFMDIPVNAMSIRAVYWRKMSENILNIHILWVFIWLNELRLKVNGCIICSTIYFPTEIDMHYVADCIALHGSIFSLFLTEKLNRER